VTDFTVPGNGSSGRLGRTYNGRHRTSWGYRSVHRTLPNLALAGWCIGRRLDLIRALEPT